MPNHLLVIDGDDSGHFFLSVHDRTLTVGTNPGQGAIILGSLRAVRIHCELEVEEGPVVLGNDPTLSAVLGQALRHGQALQVGPSHVRMAGVFAASSAADNAEVPALQDLALAEEKLAEAPALASASAALIKRLLVVDGADKGRSFPLNVTGRIAVGKSSKHADIVLHDLYVSRIHCELQVEDDGVRVTHVEGINGTLVNGQKISSQELHLGDVLRVGNSHLRFEVDVPVPVARDHVPEVEVEVEAELVAPITSPIDALNELENQVLGQYQFGALLGRGLSGLVFRANHRQTNQAVTVKVLSPDFPEGDAEVQAFVRVMKTVAPLRHPNLVTVHTAGRTGLYCWIAREYIDGESLAALIERLRKEDKLGWKRACRVAIHLGRVLNFLEQHRITLSRLTPTNVLIETATKTTKLADLMLDQALAGSQLAATIAEERLLAELTYHAPEQTEPAAAYDLRSSLYALGAVVYKLLTGEPPFTGPTPDAIVKQIREAKVIKPSKFLEMPAPFEAAILKLLARKPEDRFQSATELLAVVQPIAEASEISV